MTRFQDKIFLKTFQVFQYKFGVAPKASVLDRYEMKNGESDRSVHLAHYLYFDGEVQHALFTFTALHKVWYSNLDFNV